jgi:hypothetical protein
MDRRHHHVGEAFSIVAGGDVMAQRKQALRKKSPVKKSNAKKGDSYGCESCGLVVTVDEACGCVNVCEIVCCDMPMKKTRKAKTTAK